MYSLVVKEGVWVAVGQQVLCEGCLSSLYVSVLETSVWQEEQTRAPSRSAFFMHNSECNKAFIIGVQSDFSNHAFF